MVHPEIIIILFCLLPPISSKCPVDNIEIIDTKFSGSIQVNSDKSIYYLQDEKGVATDKEGGIQVVAGCNSIVDEEIFLHITEDPDSYFKLDSPVKGPVNKLIVLNDNVREAVPFPFIKRTFKINACNTEQFDVCKSSSVTVEFKIFNSHPPLFNTLYADASLDLSSCPSDPNTTCSQSLGLDLSATDGDQGYEDKISYSLVQVTPHSQHFSLGDPTSDNKVSISYVGKQNSFAAQTQVVLLVQAKEERPGGMSSTVSIIVEVVPAELETTTQTTETTTDTTTTSTTTTTSLVNCSDENMEKKYFIAMLVLGAVLGGILTVVFLCLIYLCIKSCCNKCGRGSVDSRPPAPTKHSIKNSGVFVEGAKFQSFKDTTYLTLRNYQPSNYSSSDSTAQDTDSTASVGRPNKWEANA